MADLRRSLIIVLGLLVCGVGTYYFLFVHNITVLPPPVLGPIQNFTLVDTNNQPFNKSALDGKVWVADLVFTSCQMTCPMMTQKLKIVSNHFANNPNFRIVSISIDPDNDTPDVLKQYAKDQGVEQDSWFFLTGKMDEIRDLAIHSFKLATPDSPSLHSDRFVLVDQSAHVRGYYDPEDPPQLRKLLQDIEFLFTENQSQR